MKSTPDGRTSALLAGSMRPGSRQLGLFFILAVALFAADPKPIYENNFQQAKPGPLPDTEFLVLDGAFEIKQEGEARFIELPGAPLDTFGVLFGPAQIDGVSASARIHGTKQGRRFPTFAVGLNGAGGYRLQVSPAKRQVELLKGDETVASAEFEWASDTWTEVRLQVRKVKEGAWRIEGKAWTQGKPEPAAWQVTADETKTAPSAGRASIWGAPFATTPIRFDDIKLAPASTP